MYDHSASDHNADHPDPGTGPHGDHSASDHGAGDHSAGDHDAGDHSGPAGHHGGGSSDPHAHGGPLRPVDEHRRRVSGLFPSPQSRVLPVSQALGRVLASDLPATTSLPPFDNSAMDGYAVRRAEITHIPMRLPVSRDIPAGSSDLSPLAEGTAARIMTGAPVPPGADFVIPVELTDAGTETVTITTEPGDRPQIRPMGDDVRAGDTVLSAGCVMGAAQIGIAAAVGYAEVPVFRPLTVLVLSTGSELAAPGSTLAPGQIFESNGPMLAAAVESAGASARLLHSVADEVAEFTRALDAQLADIDLVLTSGGVSAGAYEVVKDALTGGGVEFAKVAMQPGMPQGSGRYRGTPIVTLPGNPVSSFISFEVFVRPALRTAMGFADPHRPSLRLPISADVDSPAGRRQFRRGVLDAARGVVTPLGGPGSHLLGALAHADCLIEIAEDATRVAAGSDVTVWLLDS